MNTPSARRVFSSSKQLGFAVACGHDYHGSDSDVTIKAAPNGACCGVSRVISKLGSSEQTFQRICLQKE